MDILHVVPSYYPAFKYGGPIESVHLMNRALVSKGVNVKVFTTFAGFEGANRPCELEEIEGVKVKRFPFYFYEHYTFSPALFFEVFKEVKKYDLIHITAVWNFPVLAGSLACLVHKKPFIISPRGMLYPEAIELGSKFLKRFYFYLIASHYLKRASAVHFTTKDEKDRVASFIPHSLKSFIVPNGLDLKMFDNLPLKGSFKKKFPVLKDKKYILFLGRLHKRKGIDLLVEAYKELSKLDNDLFLVFVGPDSLGCRNEIENQLKQYNLLNRTLFTGLLNGNDKLSAYVDAEVFILPSYFENFGMAVVESMACGTPVVVSNRVGIYKEIATSNAGVVVDTNASSLYLGIKSVLDNRNMHYEIATNGRKLVQEKYDIDKVADMMISAYKDVLKR